jgi:DNA-binding IclR family transcriptional regulator
MTTPLRILTLLAEQPDGLTRAQLADHLDRWPNAVHAGVQRLLDLRLVTGVPESKPRRFVLHPRLRGKQ